MIIKQRFYRNIGRSMCVRRTFIETHAFVSLQTPLQKRENDRLAEQAHALIERAHKKYHQLKWFHIPRFQSLNMFNSLEIVGVYACCA